MLRPTINGAMVRVRHAAWTSFLCGLSVAICAAGGLISCSTRSVTADADARGHDAPQDGGTLDALADGIWCDCIPESEWKGWKSCDCAEVEWGCRASPRRELISCDIQPHCHVAVADPVTGCPMPREVCLDGCLAP